MSVQQHAAKKGAGLVVPPRILDESSTRNYEWILHFIDNLLFSLCISLTITFIDIISYLTLIHNHETNVGTPLKGQHTVILCKW